MRSAAKVILGLALVAVPLVWAGYPAYVLHASLGVSITGLARLPFFWIWALTPPLFWWICLVVARRFAAGSSGPHAQRGVAPPPERERTTARRFLKGMGLTAAVLVLALSLVTAFLFAGYPVPTRDQAKLKAIGAEARTLMAKSQESDLPKEQWPPAIASLSPEFVWVRSDGVHIYTVPYFDGGWGYFVPRDEQGPGQPTGRYVQLGHRTYWWHPY